MRLRPFVLATLAGAACFGLGVVAAQRFGAAPAPPAASTRDAGASAVSLFPADAGPRIIIDADSIQLLPDASLRLDLPPGFDAGR